MSEPVSADFDDLTDDELEALTRDRYAGTEHQLAGGAPRWYGITLIVFAIIGLIASVMLVLAEMELKADPDANLLCDINPLVGCGNSLLTWQSHLILGLPNALVGTFVFGALLAVGLAILAGARFAKWFWLLFAAAGVAGLAFVAFFLVQSLFHFHSLCPWCMVTWAVVIPFAWLTFAMAAQGGNLPLPAGFARSLVRDKAIYLGLTFVVIILAIVVKFWDLWLALLS